MSMVAEPTLVVDMGSSSTKIGFSAEDKPASVFPTITAPYARTVESVEHISSDVMDSQIHLQRSHPIERGIVKDFDQVGKVWENIMTDLNISDTDNMSTLITQTNRPGHEERTKWAEMLFETFHVPSWCMASPAPLAMYAAGRTTGVVVECGASLTCTTPVFDGFALSHAFNVMEFGGQDITALIRKSLLDANPDINFYDAKVIKEKLAFSKKQPKEQNPGVNKFELPDGTEIDVPYKVISDATESLFVNNRFTPKGLSAQVFDSLKLCDELVLNDLCQNIIISGGTSMIEGLGDRLDRDLNEKFRADQAEKQKHGSLRFRDIHVLPSTQFREAGYTTQRKHAVWIGGR